MARLSALIVALLFSAQSAFALDKRLERPLWVVAKTTAVGTGAGLVVGGAALAFMDASPRTFGKIASIGLLGGALFGLFVLLAPTEAIYGTPTKQKERRDAPRRWESDDGWREEESRYDPRGGFDSGQAVAGWVPVINTSF